MCLIKKFFRKKGKQLNSIKAKTGRLNNVIYRKDGQSEDHLNEALDKVLWKHHG